MSQSMALLYGIVGDFYKDLLYVCASPWLQFLHIWRRDCNARKLHKLCKILSSRDYITYVQFIRESVKTNHALFSFLNFSTIWIVHLPASTVPSANPNNIPINIKTTAAFLHSLIIGCRTKTTQVSRICCRRSQHTGTWHCHPHD